MIEKVGVYCRLSDEDRDKVNKTDDSDSIVNQRSMCLKFANQNGWNVVDIYSDDDFSGAGTYRPDFERLLKDCESGKINLVLCKSQSRFSRDMEVIEKYIHGKFLEWGVRFVSIIDNADTSVESNKKSRQINGLINEWYLEDLSRNIRKSLKNKREDGLFMGSFAPYGYVRSEDGRKLLVDPVAAKVVKKIFELYANGYGYHRICVYLNNNNIPPRCVYKKQQGSKYNCCNINTDNVVWNPDTIAQMLRNEVYIGNLVQGTTTYISYKIHKQKKTKKEEWTRTENAHEPIIDKETWNTVQQRLSTHVKVNNKGILNKFTRKVYCKECNQSFMRTVYHVKTSPTGQREYLQCKGNKKYDICDNNRSIREDELEEVVLKEINNLLDNYYNKDKLKELAEKRKLQLNEDEKEINTLNKEKENVEKEINENKRYYKSLYENKVNGTINEDMFKMMSEDYLKEIEKLTKRVEIIDKELEEIKSKENKHEDGEELLKKYKHIDKLNRTIIDEFIDKIYIGKLDKVTKKRDIEINWNFEF